MAGNWQPAGSSSQNKISLHKEAELPPLTVISAAAQVPIPVRDSRDKDYGPASGGFQPQLDPPGPDRIFRLESEKSLNERLKREVKELIISSLNLEDLTVEGIDDDAPLFQEGLELDSIDALELAVAIERRFRVTIPDEAVGKKAFSSVNALTAYIAAQKPA